MSTEYISIIQAEIQRNGRLFLDKDSAILPQHEILGLELVGTENLVLEESFMASTVQTTFRKRRRG